MVIQQILEFVTTYISDYFSILLVSIIQPKDIKGLISKGKIEPKILGYGVLSVIIGYSLLRVAENREAIELETLVIVALIMWLVFSIIFFIVAKIIGGKANLVESISVSLVFISTAYVIASLIALISSIFFVSGFLFDAIFYGTQWVMLSIYLSIGFHSIHFSETHDEGETIYRVPMFLIGIPVIFFVGLIMLFRFAFDERTNIPIVRPTQPTPTITATETPTSTPTNTPTSTPTTTPTNTPTSTPINTSTITPTQLKNIDGQYLIINEDFKDLNEWELDDSLSISDFSNMRFTILPTPNPNDTFTTIFLRYDANTSLPFKTLEFKGTVNASAGSNFGFNTSCEPNTAKNAMYFNLSTYPNPEITGGFDTDEGELTWNLPFQFGESYTIRFVQDDDIVRVFVNDVETSVPYPCSSMGEWLSIGVGMSKNGFVDGYYEYIRLWSEPLFPNNN